MFMESFDVKRSDLVEVCARTDTDLPCPKPLKRPMKTCRSGLEWDHHSLHMIAVLRVQRSHLVDHFPWASSIGDYNGITLGAI